MSYFDKIEPITGGFKMLYNTNDAPVLMVFGQSNAHGHGLAMEDCDRITHPITNVYALNTAENQKLDLSDCVWSGYTSHGTNLGETQDNTYCMPNYFARYWEEHANELPPLFIIRISVGAQGVTRNYMWNPDYEHIMIPGPLGTVKIALYRLACHVIDRAFAGIRRMGKNPCVLALHWIGGEEEICVPPKQLEGLTALYNRIFDGFRAAAGGDFPIYLYRVLCRQRVSDISKDPAGLDAINYAFDSLTEKMTDTSIVTAEQCPLYNEKSAHNGIYMPDNVHYTREVQNWFAKREFLRVIS